MPCHLLLPLLLPLRLPLRLNAEEASSAAENLSLRPPLAGSTRSPNLLT